jgi:hypothetical protein
MGSVQVGGRLRMSRSMINTTSFKRCILGSYLIVLIRSLTCAWAPPLSGTGWAA